MESALINSNCHSYQLQLLNLFILMYADDTVLFTEDANDLQNMLDCLQTYSDKWNLTVNINKTKIVVFRKSKRLTPTEHWTFQGKDIDVVHTFCYLGLVFNYNGRFTVAHNTLASQGRKAYYLLKSRIKNYMLNAETKLSLFDTYVSCILNYCCEVWGHHPAPKIEAVHLLFLKGLLNVKKTVNSSMVYFETGRYSLHVQRKIMIMKYWLKLLKTNNCILKSCYVALLELNIKKPNCKLNWVYEIKDDLCRHGFNYVWIAQNVNNEKHFLELYTQRLHDIFIQDLHSSFNNSSKCQIYKYLANYFELQYYLTKSLNSKTKQILSKYRMQAHSLHIESGRYNAVPRGERICTVCNNNDIEDEMHFILLCPAYVELRMRFLKKYYYKHPSVFKLIELFSYKNIKTLRNLGKYSVHATDQRNNLMNL
ncbi:uncharacterized protein LOC117330985 [Pecten maximus]|uniref:uncharacterized protein LOC117330985 n=1 Tax=Pecten maximus TaxID=6579 RepID=UPI001458C1E3|nr:uncharacterized protein LOC117330985 [Pecten maximus]